MVSMSYCRFENTYKELSACADALEDVEPLSRSEYDYRLRLLDLCKDMLENCQCVVELPEGGIEDQFPPFEEQ